jgi:PGF-CTERM protein
MKKKIIAGLIAIVAIVAVVMCTGFAAIPQAIAVSEPTLPSGYNWYYDDEFKFGIGYPEDWELVPEEEEPSGEGILGVAMFLEPGSRINFFLVAVEDSECDIEKFKATSDYGEDVVINGREGYDAIRENPMVKQRAVQFTVEDRCYGVSCNAATDLYDEYAEIFETAINSFVIESPAPVTQTPSPSPSPSEMPTSTPVAEVPEEPGFEIVFAITALLAVTYLLKRRG